MLASLSRAINASGLRTALRRCGEGKERYGSGMPLFKPLLVWKNGSHATVLGLRRCWM
jgi:hypothetical protein